MQYSSVNSIALVPEPTLFKYKEKYSLNKGRDSVSMLGKIE